MRSKNTNITNSQCTEVMERSFMDGSDYGTQALPLSAYGFIPHCHLQYVSTRSKHLSLVKVVIWLTLPTFMLTEWILEGNIRKYAGGGSITA
jgi:hypothetical protein